MIRVIVYTKAQCGGSELSGELSCCSGDMIQLADGSHKAIELLVYGDALPEPTGVRTVEKVESYDDETGNRVTLSEAPE